MSPDLQEMSDLSHLIKKSLMQNITFCVQVQSLVWKFNSRSAKKNVSILPVLNFANFPITEFGISGHKKTFCITIPLFYGMQRMVLDYLKKHYLPTQMKWMFYVFLESFNFTIFAILENIIIRLNLWVPNLKYKLSFDFKIKKLP